MTWRYSHLAPAAEQRAVDLLRNEDGVRGRAQVPPRVRATTAGRDEMALNLLLMKSCDVRYAKVAELADAPDLGSGG